MFKAGIWYSGILSANSAQANNTYKVLLRRDMHRSANSPEKRLELFSEKISLFYLVKPISSHADHSGSSSP